MGTSDTVRHYADGSATGADKIANVIVKCPSGLRIDTR